MALTEIEKKIQKINMLNNLMTFKYLPVMYENLKNIRDTHGQLMDRYAELIELHKTEGEYEMKNANQIRQLLKDAIGYKRDYAYSYIIKKCKEALTFFPCETCNGEKWLDWQHPKVVKRLAEETGPIPQQYPCPDCQPCERCGGTNGAHRQVNDPQAGNSHMLTKMQCPLDK